MGASSAPPVSTGSCRPRCRLRRPATGAPVGRRGEGGHSRQHVADASALDLDRRCRIARADHEIDLAIALAPVEQLARPARRRVRQVGAHGGFDQPSPERAARPSLRQGEAASGGHQGGVHAHDDMTARCRHVTDAPGGRMPAVGGHMAVRADGEVRQGLVGTPPFRCRESEEAAGRGGKVDAVVQPPRRARPAGLPDRRRVERPDPETAVARHRDSLFAKQLHARRVPPILRFSQPPHQRRGRQIDQTRHPGPHDAPAQRMSASDVKQQHPQQRLDRLVLAQALQRPVPLANSRRRSGGNNINTAQSSSTLARSPSCTGMHDRKQ